MSAYERGPVGDSTQSAYVTRAQHAEVLERLDQIEARLRLIFLIGLGLFLAGVVVVVGGVLR